MCRTKLAVRVAGVAGDRPSGVVLEDTDGAVTGDTALEVVRRRRQVDSFVGAVVAGDHVADSGTLFAES